DPVQVTIVPRGPAGGVTWMSGNDHAFLAREQAIAQLTVALGGRAAEEVLLGSHTQGAAGDLDSATRLATAMATEYGMTRPRRARRRSAAHDEVEAAVLRETVPQQTIEAAGGVLWRDGGAGPEVALVHRQRHDDWSIPKGKAKPGEHPIVTAVREVDEETGF